METSPLPTRGNKLTQASHNDYGGRGKYRIQAVIDFLSKHYGLTITLIGGTIILLLAFDHIDTANHLRNFHAFFFQDIILVILLMGTIWFLTRSLLSALAERSHVINILRLKNEVGLNLSSSQDVPELSKRVVQQVASLFPFVEIELYLYEKKSNWFARAVYENDAEFGDKESGGSRKINLHPCRNCLATNNMKIHSLTFCQQDNNFLRNKGAGGFCLPLIDGVWPVGLLHLYPSHSETLEAGQIELLENISPDLAHAIGVVLEEASRNENILTQKIHTMQLDIARDLHDTVGQNIGYLRMKLDHLSEMDSQKSTDLKMEVINMSRVANESYDLIRGTLAMLQSENSADLFRLFTRYAQQIEKRSSFKIDFSSQGEPRILSPKRMRQLFYIFREALNNVEKHANASQVSLEMTWNEYGLTLVVFDNGTGFELDKVEYGSHFGLKFMRERTELLNGSLTLHSAIGSGTNITLQIPYE